ncbi:hypothetical protein [Thermogemmatispora carboxidivorans]|uniref:hypothetical protein n=1 Tax=Thermogemmatispora carboxidivorans TaxID=1382306 RepID=UPI00069B6A94|nr:hypothetical protein [Thermogemmatispora carboxidivorans]
MNVSTGGSHILIFERDQQLAALLSSELQLAGYECHIARTAVEVFDAIARHQVRLVLVNLAQAAAGRREFWVALEAQRRGRGVLVLTYRCTNLAGYGPYDPEEHRQSVDVEVDGMLGIMRLAEAVRAQVPLPATASHPQVRLADLPTQASPSPTLTSLQQTVPHPAVFSPSQSQVSELQRQSPPAPSTYATSLQAAPAVPPSPTFTDKIRAVIYPGSRSFSPAPAAVPAPAPAQEAAWGAAFGADAFQGPDGFVASASPSSARIPAVSPVASPGSRQPPLNQAGQFSPASHASPSPAQPPYYPPSAQAAPPELYAQQRSQPLEPLVQESAEPFYQATRSQASGPLPQPQTALAPQDAPPQMAHLPSMTQASPSPFASAPQLSQPAPAYQPVFQESPYQPNQAYTQYAPPEEKGESSLAQLTRLLRERSALSAPGERGPESGEAQMPPGGTAAAPAAPAPPSPLSTASLRAAPIQGLQSDQEPDYRPSRSEVHAAARSHLQALAGASPTIGELSSLRMAPPSSASAPAAAQSQAAPHTHTAQARAYTAEQPAVERRPAYSSPHEARGEDLSPVQMQMRNAGPVERVEREAPAAPSQPLASDDLAATADEETKKEMMHAEAAPVESARRPSFERESITSDTTLLDIVQSLPPMEPPPQRQQPQSPLILNGRATRSLGSVLLEGHLVPPERLEVAQNVQRMLRGVDLNYQLGEILLMFKLLTPDQLLAASLVSYGLLNTAQIRSLGRIRQELHSMGLEYDLENLLILFRILTPEQLREVRASWSS